MADLSSLLGSAGIGGAIGKAIVSLELETTKYKAELDAAQAQTASSANSMSSGLASFKGLAVGAFAGAATAAVAFAATSVSAALEANEAQLRLQNTFANNPRLADSSTEAFTRQADSLRDLTGVDDEAIISSQALLGQFDLTGDQVMQLIPLIVDLSEKMGIDLETAARAVGKATQGNTGSLARYGITIADTDSAAGAFTATLDGLGVAQGFAADQAKAEPWRVLSAQFEELQETVGQALIPILQAIVPVLQDVVTVLQFATGATEGFDKAVQNASRSLAEHELNIAAWLEEHLQSIPIISNVMNVYEQFKPILDENSEALETQRGVIGDISDFYRGRLVAAVQSAGEATAHFAHMTVNELQEWKTGVGKAIDSYIFDLNNLESHAKQTRRKFIQAHKAMLDRARETAQALREIAREDWVNPNYIKFLADEGPGALTNFASLNDKKQHAMQQAWKETTRLTDDAKGSLDSITGALDDLDNGHTKHEVEIHYTYSGFDPSKPGMGGMGAQP